MPAKKAGGQLSSPWKEFLTELDERLGESLELHRIGGFALVYFYGFPHTTADIDYCSAVPANLNLDEVLVQLRADGDALDPFMSYPPVQLSAPHCMRVRYRSQN